MSRIASQKSKCEVFNANLQSRMPEVSRRSSSMGKSKSYPIPETVYRQYSADSQRIPRENRLGQVHVDKPWSPPLKAGPISVTSVSNSPVRSVAQAGASPRQTCISLRDSPSRSVEDESNLEHMDIIDVATAALLKSEQLLESMSNLDLVEGEGGGRSCPDDIAMSSQLPASVQPMDENVPLETMQELLQRWRIASESIRKAGTIFGGQCKHDQDTFLRGSTMDLPVEGMKQLRQQLFALEQKASVPLMDVTDLRTPLAFSQAAPTTLSRWSSSDTTFSSSPRSSISVDPVRAQNFIQVVTLGSCASTAGQGMHFHRPLPPPRCVPSSPRPMYQLQTVAVTNVYRVLPLV